MAIGQEVKTENGKKNPQIKNELLPAVNEVFVFEQMKNLSGDLLNKQKGADHSQVVVSLM